MVAHTARQLAANTLRLAPSPHRQTLQRSGAPLFLFLGIMIGVSGKSLSPFWRISRAESPGCLRSSYWGLKFLFFELPCSSWKIFRADSPGCLRSCLPVSRLLSSDTLLASLPCRQPRLSPVVPPWLRTFFLGCLDGESPVQTAPAVSGRIIMARSFFTYFSAVQWPEHQMQTVSTVHLDLRAL